MVVVSVKNVIEGYISTILVVTKFAIEPRRDGALRPKSEFISKIKIGRRLETYTIPKEVRRKKIVTS